MWYIRFYNEYRYHYPCQDLQPVSDHLDTQTQLMSTLSIHIHVHCVPCAISAEGLMSTVNLLWGFLAPSKLTSHSKAGISSLILPDRLSMALNWEWGIHGVSPGANLPTAFFSTYRIGIYIQTEWEYWKLDRYIAHHIGIHCFNCPIFIWIRRHLDLNMIRFKFNELICAKLSLFKVLHHNLHDEDL